MLRKINSQFFTVTWLSAPGNDKSHIRNVALVFAVIVWLLSSNFNTYGQQPAVRRYRLSVAESKWALELEIPTVSMPAAKRTRTTQIAFFDPVEHFTKDGNAALLSDRKSVV